MRLLRSLGRGGCRRAVRRARGRRPGGALVWHDDDRGSPRGGDRSLDPGRLRASLRRSRPERRARGADLRRRRRDCGVVARRRTSSASLDSTGRASRAARRPTSRWFGSQTAAERCTVNETRFEKLAERPGPRPRRSGSDKHLVYYDGPVASDSTVRRGWRYGRRRRHCDRLPRGVCGRADGGRRHARAAPCLRGAAGERPSQRLPRLDGAPVRLERRHPLSVRARQPAGSAGARRRAATTTTRTPARGSTCRTRAGSASSTRQIAARPDHRGRWLGRERRARDRVLDELHHGMGAGLEVVARCTPGRGPAVRPLDRRLHGHGRVLSDARLANALSRRLFAPESVPAHAFRRRAGLRHRRRCALQRPPVHPERQLVHRVSARRRPPANGWRFAGWSGCLCAAASEPAPCP